MSTIKIESNPSGTGVFTLASPNSNTNRTLTLPDNTGTILTSATTTGFPAGSVLQVVQGTTSTQVSVTSGGYTDTNLTATITPKSSSSKILIFVSQAIATRISSGSQYGGIRLLRGSTVILYPAEFSGQPVDFGLASYGIDVFNRACINYLDSPATTSATTYKTQGRPYNTGGSMVFQPTADQNPTSTIILMEIAA